jgi:hypothetical protein
MPNGDATLPVQAMLLLLLLRLGVTAASLRALDVVAAAML